MATAGAATAGAANRPDRRSRWFRGSLAVVGAGLLWASGAVHLDLYATGYRRIPTIGTLFLLQAAVGVMLGLAGVVVARPSRPRDVAGTLVSTAAGLFALGTVAAYAVSRGPGLFGFRERPTGAGLVAGLLEVGAFAAFGGVALLSSSRSGGATVLVASAAGAVALVAVGLVLGHVPGPPAPSRTTRDARALASSPARPVVRVRISDYEFHPDRVRARPGEVIAVTNDDQVTHTMTAVPGSLPFGKFDTGYVDPGRTVRIRAPRMPGSYAFYCSIHNFMKGVLVVTG